MAAVSTFIINKGYDDERTVEGATGYATTPDGNFVDFVNRNASVQVLRILASQVVTVDLKKDGE